MLYEVNGIKQIKDEHVCRWFMDDYFDLFVWFKSRGDIYGFQLCYNKNFNERALNWWEKSGFSHLKVDDGENMSGGFKMTPILVADGIFDYENVIDKFKKESKEIDLYIRKFILKKLNSYSR